MAPATRRRRSGGRRPARGGAVAAGAVVLAVAAVAVSVTLGPDNRAATEGGDGTASASPSSPSSPSSRAAGHEAPSPSPTRSYPLSKTPETIPAVRRHTPAHGPGWKPGSGERVVVGDDKLADEGRLIADELKLSYGGRAKAGDGDVELALAPGDGGSESYTMRVSGGRVRITGPTDAGVFYGTRTLKQEVAGGTAAPEGEVSDAPAKPQRGFMLDIARKTYSVDWIEDRIRELGDLKFNQLGLHFSDDQGFRIESATHPEIVSKDHLSKDQVRALVKLAASRHIQVVPELDSPGHLGAVTDAHPDLQLRNASGQTLQGTLDISKPGAAKIVDDLLKEYAPLFPGRYWHLGGDEYLALMSSDPTASYPQLAEAARDKYGAKGTIEDLTTAWLNGRAAVVRPTHESPKAWNDGFYDGGSVSPDKDLEVAYWTGKEAGRRDPQEFLAEGRKLTNYNDEYLYYVLGQPNDFTYPTGERIYADWTPRVIRGTEPVPAKYDDQILGGSFAVWGDQPQAQTADQVAAGIKLPLCATSQKLWDAGKPPLSWAAFKGLAGKVV
ncbi:glycoside hydrolase family 20 protein [Streptomyces sp. NPDC050560]|uniref:glycoside hydrolase family 20 protein n=1 Tax=Streptomyces sp. NPDC050560 TaxID=3365630 RepID=UPI0037B8F838